jgi:hypothetical protein
MGKRVAIFGSGLSAAFVYAACKANAVEADFYTDHALAEQPDLGHVILRWVPYPRAIPYDVYFFSMGSLSDYLVRMGRDHNDVLKTAFPVVGRSSLKAYNPYQAIDTLLPKEAKVTLGKFSDHEIYVISRSYDHTFVTFPMAQSRDPAKLIFYWSYSLPGRDLSLPNMAIYNATNQFSWTRFTQYWGIMTWEYSHKEYPAGEGSRMPPRPGNLVEPKRVADIAPGVPEYVWQDKTITLVGRWARWNKSVLAHEGYEQAEEVIKEITDG